MSKDNNQIFKFISEFNNNLSYICNGIINYSTKHNFKLLIPFFKFILNNKGFIFIILLILSYYHSNFIIYFLNLFLLFDSIILSLLIIQNNLVFSNARRLAKNVILSFFLYFNIFGSLITFLICLFIYLEFSKFINKIIFKILKLLMIYFKKLLPFMTTLYPTIHDINFDSNDNTISETTYSNIKKKKKKKY